MPTELESMLQTVNQAIEQVLTRGQDVTVNGRRYTRANLAELRAWRSELKAELSQRRQGGLRVRRVIPRD